MDKVKLVVNSPKVLTNLDNSVPLALLRLIYLVHAGGNNNSIFISKLYYLYNVSLDKENLKPIDILVTTPFSINKNLRKMVVLLSSAGFITLEKKSGKLKLLLTERGEAVIAKIDTDDSLKQSFVKIGSIVRMVTDSDLKKQQLMW